MSDFGGSPFEWYSQGAGTNCNVYFRMRVIDAPTKTTGGVTNIFNGIWVVAVGKQVSGVSKTLLWTGVNGGNPSYVYVYDPATARKLFNQSVTGIGSNSGQAYVATTGARNNSLSPAKDEYFVYWKVPQSYFSDVGASGPIGMFAGTSQSNSLSSINADTMDGLGTTPDYGAILPTDPSVTTNSSSCSAPTLTNINPNIGSTSGGTSVRVSGTNLVNITGVRFGSDSATISSFDSSTQITVRSPARSAGLDSVSIFSSCGNTTLSSPQFEYRTDLTPTSTSFSAPAMTVATPVLLSATVKNSTGTSTLTTATGSYTFYKSVSGVALGAELCTSTAEMSAGVASCYFAPDSVNPITITAVYSGDGQFITSQTTGSAVTPSKKYTSVKFTPPDSATMSTINLIATVFDSSVTNVLSGVTGAMTFTGTYEGLASPATLCTVNTSWAFNTSGTSVFSETVYFSGGIAACDWSLGSSDRNKVWTITATYGGDLNYFSSNQTGRTGTLSQTLTMSDSSVAYNLLPRILSGSATNNRADGGEISYAVSDPGTAQCQIAGTQLSWSSPGTCVISANAASTTNYFSSDPVTATFTITAVTPSLSLANATASYGSTVNLSSLLTDGNSSGGAVTYSVAAGSDNCEISSSTLTAKRASGTCTIQASKAASTGYNSTTATGTITLSTRSITVKAADVSKLDSAPDPSFTGFSITSGTLYGSDTITSVTATRAAGTAAGNYTITIDPTNGVTFSPTSLSDSYTVTLSTGTLTITSASLLTQTVTFSDSSVVYTSRPRSLTGAATTNGNGTITYTLSNAGTAICSVSANELTWTNTGTCTLTATASSTATYNASSPVTATFTITETPTASTVDPEDLDKNRAKLKGGANQTLDIAEFCLGNTEANPPSNCPAGHGEKKSATKVGSDYIFEATGLTPSTRYYYYFYGNKNGNDVVGEVKTFKTKPNVRTDTSTAVLAKSARLNATVSETLTNPRFCYKATSFTNLSDCLTGGVIDTATAVSGGDPALRMGLPKISKNSGPSISFNYLKARISPTPTGSLVTETTYILSVSGLTPNTTYYYIIYGTVDGAQYDGGVQNFTTPAEESGGGGTGGGGGGSGGSSSTPVVNPGPTINSISRTLVCFTGTELTILGSDFNDGKVTLDGNSVVIRDISGSTIRVVLPSSSAGRRVITVTTPYGSAVAYIEYVSVPKPVFEPIRIPYLAQGSSISLPFVASNATSYGFVGKLPSGLTMNSSTGEISGISTENGIFVLTLTASNPCGDTQQFVELDIDAPTPNAISHRINFLPGSCSIPDSAKESLERFLEKAKGLSPRNLIPEIYVSGGGKASDPNSPLADCRQEAICDFLLLENLLGEVLSDVFTGAENRVEIIVYWPRPNDDL